MRLAAALLLLSGSAFSASFDLTWTPPTENVDGTSLTDLEAYGIYWDCGAGEQSDLIFAPATGYTVEGLPDEGTCEFTVTAINTAGEESVRSGVLVQEFVSVPDAPTDAPNITWAEPSMALVIEVADSWLDASDNLASTSQGIDLPAYSDGDLVVIGVGMIPTSNGVSAITWPTAPNGETITSVVNTYSPGDSVGIPRIAIGWFIGDGAASATTITITVPIVEIRVAMAGFVVPAGEFDASTPISTATSSAGSTSDETAMPMAGFTANSDDGGGKLLAFLAGDIDPIDSTAITGWTELQRVDAGRTAIALAARDAAVTNSESIGSAAFTHGSDAWATYGFIVREAEAGGGGGFQAAWAVNSTVTIQ